MTAPEPAHGSEGALSGALAMLIDPHRSPAQPRPRYGPRSGEGLRGRAGAHQVPVTVGLVDAPDRGPVLSLAGAGHRVGGLGAVVGVLPLPRDQHLGGVRGVLQRVVVAVVLSRAD